MRFSWNIDACGIKQIDHYLRSGLMPYPISSHFLNQSMIIIHESTGNNLNKIHVACFNFNSFLCVLRFVTVWKSAMYHRTILLYNVEINFLLYVIGDNIQNDNLYFMPYKNLDAKQNGNFSIYIYMCVCMYVPHALWDMRLRIARYRQPDNSV